MIICELENMDAIHMYLEEYKYNQANDLILHLYKIGKCVINIAFFIQLFMQILLFEPIIMTVLS